MPAIPIGWEVIIGMFLVSVVFPMMALIYTTVAARRDRKEDRERQDQIAKDAAAAAAAAAAQVNKDARAMLVLTESANKGSQTIVGRLVVIHDLVNSDMTARIESELAGIRREEAMMIELIDMKRKAGHDPTVETLKELGATQARIKDLVKTLEQRQAQQDKVDAEKAANAKLTASNPEAKP